MTLGLLDDTQVERAYDIYLITSDRLISMPMKHMS
jgi:hypothetical protein